MNIKRKIMLLSVLVLGSVLIVGIGHAAEVLSISNITLPVILHRPPPPTLQDAWVAEQTGIRAEIYGPGETVEFHILGDNPANPMIEVHFQWQQTGDCGDTLLYDELLSLPLGDWGYVFTGVMPDCLGSYANTVTISHQGYTSTRTTDFTVVDTSSQIIISQAHGFEKCGLPSVAQMQTWKQYSPYEVFNIYLGGDHFACNLLIDDDWVRAAAQQGWDFILTWAGHGTYCWEDDHPISSNPIRARREGRAAAEEAILAARDLGFLGQKIIYYDVEGYTDVDTCRLAMEAFLEGWSERLHESGDKAGAYGSPCTSYILDWADNDPPLDDIWFARWSDDGYNEDANIDDSESQYCPLPDNVWPDRRIRQYAGDHSETYGPCDEDDDTCTLNGITSNVLNGEITRFLLGE